MTSRRAAVCGIVASLAHALFGLVARQQILERGFARPHAVNIFFRLYALYEAPFLVGVALVAIAAAIVLVAPRGALMARDTWIDAREAPDRTVVLLVAAVTFIVTVVITHFVLYGYAFSMDEFSADFQARVFARGSASAALPGFWQPFAYGLTPVFVALDSAGASWNSVYLPVYSFLKAPFVAVGAPTLLNPLLAALTVVALGAVAGRLWPRERLRPWLAIALLLSSSEFLVTTGTAYSMPAHLLLNLVWLWLYLRDDARSWAAALLVGALALGLHNPFPHALFVAPFLVRLVRDRRWSRIASAAVAYGVASVAWFAWLSAVRPPNAGPGALDVFALPNLQVLWLHGINLSLLLTWQAPLFGILVVAALCQPRRLGAPLADLAWGVLLTLGFYLFFASTQGHGWGYRYAYQVLGNLALLGAAGIVPLVEAMGRRRAQLLVAAALLLAVAVEVPLRLANTQQFVRPFAAGAEFLQSREASVVLVHGDSIWYGRDLIRNDPFLEGQPVILSATNLTPAGRAYLERAFPGKVLEVSDSELLRLGMTRWTNHP
jgi:hypothetical protein